MFLDFSRRFEPIYAKPFFEERKDLVFTNDYQEPLHKDATPASMINSGVFLTRGTPWAQKFWAEVWESFPFPEGMIIPGVGGNSEQTGIELYRLRHPEEFQ